MLQKYQQGGVEVFQLHDRLTIDECETAREWLLAALPERLPEVVLDLRKLRLIDSAGLELLCEVQGSCMSRGGSIRLAAASPLVSQILQVTGLDQEFALHQDVLGAAGAFAQ